METINWNDICDWDLKYLIKCMDFHDSYKPFPIERTEGDYLITPDGEKYLDFFNQLVCVNAGQRNEKIIQRVREALERYGFVHDGYLTDYKARVAKLIIEDLLGDEDWPGKIRYASTGSEAVEVASMIARLYTGKPYIATREYAFHGLTGASVALTRLYCTRNYAVTKEGELDVIPNQGYPSTILCPMPNCYRCSLGYKYPECKSLGSELPCVKATERMILSHGLDEVAAIITEPVAGAGMVVPPEEYLPQIYAMTRRLGILWIADEVQTAFGRLGTWFGYQKYEGIHPDILTMAKGLSSSQIPCAAVLVSKEISDYLDKVSWQYISTFAGHPIAMAAVQGNIEYMIENRIPEKATEDGQYFGDKLRELMEKHKTVGAVLGSGLMWQVELVKDKQTREPFVPIDRNCTMAEDIGSFPTTIIGRKCKEKGVLMGGFLPNTMRIACSLTVSKESMDKAIDALDYALTYLDSLV